MGGTDDRGTDRGTVRDEGGEGGEETDEEEGRVKRVAAGLYGVTWSSVWS